MRLTIHTRTMRTSVSTVPPKKILDMIVTGIATSSQFIAPSSLKSPAGIGRHFLLMESSTMELGSRWFAIVPTKTFNQVTKITTGSLLTSSYSVGVWLEVVIKGPDKAAATPKRVTGSIVVLISLNVKS